MRSAEHRRPQQPAKKPGAEAGAAPAGALQLDREAVSEQEGEQQVELRLEDDRDEPAHRVGDCSRVGRVAETGELERRCEERDVDDDDPEQREAAQCVDQLDTGRGRRVRHESERSNSSSDGSVTGALHAKRSQT